MTNRSLARFFAALTVAAAVAACSSDSGGGSGGDVSCDTLCNYTGSLPCSNTTKAQCVSSCQTSSAEHGECGQSFVNYTDCLIRTLGCDISSTPPSELASVCTSQTVAYSACDACRPDPDDDACDTCSKSNCCSQRKTAYGDAGVLAASLCIVDCYDSACADACLAQHPGAMEKLQAVTTCEQSACPGC